MLYWNNVKLFVFSPWTRSWSLKTFSAYCTWLIYIYVILVRVFSTFFFIHRSWFASEICFGALDVTHSAVFHTSIQQHKPGNITLCQTSRLSSSAVTDSNKRSSQPQRPSLLTIPWSQPNFPHFFKLKSKEFSQLNMMKRRTRCWHFLQCTLDFAYVVYELPCLNQFAVLNIFRKGITAKMTFYLSL